MRTRREASTMTGTADPALPAAWVEGRPMATYLYRCAEHGCLEVSLPMGSAPSQCACPHCGGVAARVFTAPRLSRGSAAHRALLDRTAASADSPAVVSAPPPAPRPATRPHNPALARLTRP
jgi:putative FmdB family regulatory protein